MDLFASFLALPKASSAMGFAAFPLDGRRADFLARSSDGGPVFLLHDASPASYSPAIDLKYVAVQFHSTCRVTTTAESIEDQFAVISCNANAPDLHEVFVRCVAAAIEQLPSKASTSDLQQCVQALLDLFRALGRPSSREVTGLWAELFVILQSKNVARALDCWHTDPFERFDFSWGLGCLEVKAALSGIRQHNFALEQLKSPLGGMGYVTSILLQPLAGGVGVMDLANDIERAVAAYPMLRQKLWQNIATALGNDFSERLDRRFDSSYAERNLAVYAMTDIPAPLSPSDPRVTAVRFRVDLSSVTSSIAGTPVNILRTCFV
jgi:hypothetical protein